MFRLSRADQLFVVITTRRARMKKRLITLSLLVAAWTGVCFGADVPLTGTVSQPGQLASASATDLGLKPGVMVFNTPGTQFLSPEMRHERTVNRIWVVTLVAVAASTSMDAATSWGKREGNGFLASSDGTFGARGLGIKAGMLAGVIVPQLIFRHHKELKAKFVVGNLIEAGIFTGVSIHNLGVTAQR
jgi:hypothetical protein